MKKILILLLFVPLFSCNDWLTVETEDSVTFVNYFKNVPAMIKRIPLLENC